MTLDIWLENRQEKDVVHCCENALSTLYICIYVQSILYWARGLVQTQSQMETHPHKKTKHKKKKRQLVGPKRKPKVWFIYPEILKTITFEHMLLGMS